MGSAFSPLSCNLAAMNNSLAFLFQVTCLVLCSVGRSVVAKSVSQIRAHGIDGFHTFAKPLFLTLLLFIGMSGALVFTLAAPRRRKRDKGSENEEDADESRHAHEQDGVADDMDSSATLHSVSDVRCCSKQFWLPALSAVLEIAAALLYFKSLMSLPAALNEIVQFFGDFVGFAVILFATRATSSVSPREVAGAVLCTTGMVLAAATHMSYLSDLAASASSPLYAAAARRLSDAATVALLLVVPRAVVSGVQQLIDVRLMQSAHMSAALLVGMRGLHGIWLTIPLLLLADHALPGDDYGGRLESTHDSLTMLRNSQPLFLLLFIFIAVVCAQQYFQERVRAQRPNELTSALWRVARAPTVWLVSLLLWWATPPRWHIGEATNVTSVIVGRAMGIVLLFAGSTIFYADHAGAQLDAILACWQSPLPWRSKLALCCQCCCRDCGREHRRRGERRVNTSPTQHSRGPTPTLESDSDEFDEEIGYQTALPQPDVKTLSRGPGQFDSLSPVHATDKLDSLTRNLAAAIDIDPPVIQPPQPQSPPRAQTESSAQKRAALDRARQLFGDDDDDSTTAPDSSALSLGRL